MDDDTPAMVGKYGKAVRAPAGLRSAMKLGELQRAIETADEWRRLEADISARRTALVMNLRSRGASWDAIGWLLGMTGVGARKRYRRDEA